jgi:hypothetical protein
MDLFTFTLGHSHRKIKAANPRFTLSQHKKPVERIEQRPFVYFGDGKRPKFKW